MISVVVLGGAGNTSIAAVTGGGMVMYKRLSIIKFQIVVTPGYIGNT